MKIGIVGSGLVGSTTAYALVMRGVGREVVMVDHIPGRASAEADDIMHAVPFAHPLRIRAGEYADLVDARVVIIAAGVNQKPGETRLQLLQRNAAVFAEVVPQIVQAAPGAVILVATNPVDIMTHVATQIAHAHGARSESVLGSGTTLDSARFRTLVGNHFDVDSRHVHAHVIGEHGDSEVLAWSQATISGLSLEEYGALHGQALDVTQKREIDRRVRQAAYHIIEGKGATYYGIGSALAQIVSVILHDQRSIMTVCSRMERVAGVEDVTISTPQLFGGQGVIRPLPLHLSDKEMAGLAKSAAVIREAIGSLDPLS
ncbi:MAG: L-lactate dehydrogenase [Aureliella sp.]